MAKGAGQYYYKIVQGFLRDSNHGKIQPVLTTVIKKYGLTQPTLGKMLVHHLCMENNVDGALGLINALNRNNFKVNFPVDVLGTLTEHGRSLDAYKLVLGAQGLPSMNLVDYSVIIDGLCKEGYIDEALELCNFARKRGIALNVVTYNSIFNGLCRHSCLVEAFRLFDSLERNNINPSDITYGTLIDALVREGFLSDARKLFEKMVLEGIQPNSHIYNSLIFGYSKSGNVKEALRLLHDLQNRSLEPEDFTISAVIYGFSLAGDMEGALEFFIGMKRIGFSPDLLGFLYLIRGLCAKGRMEEARGVLREMLQNKSIVELINRVDVEIENESMENLLVHLCEQGSIKDVLTILNEIGYIFFPYKRNTFPTGKNPDISLHPLSHGRNFDALYSQMASLCSVGDLQGANELAKGMISSFAKNRDL